MYFHRNFQVCVDVLITDVQQNNYNVAEYFIPKSLNDFDIELLNASPKSDAIVS